MWRWAVEVPQSGDALSCFDRVPVDRAGPVTVSYGSWPSPIAAEHLVAGAATPIEVIADGGDVWYVESRPAQGGRVALMRVGAGDSEPVEVTPPDANVRTRVHEYGGGAWWVGDGTAWYVDDSDQRLRRLDPDGTISVLTPEPTVARGLRYADGRATPDKAWFVCVRENHLADSTGEHSEPVNELVAVAGDGSGRVEIVTTGADFYSTPRLSADGERLCWVQWNHPNMSWDATELWVADWVDGRIGTARRVGGDGMTSVVMPGFSRDGSLMAVADSDEWWNLYRYPTETEVATGSMPPPEPVLAGSFEIATPGWVFGLSRWVDTDRGIIAAATDPGGEMLIDVSSGETSNEFSAISSLTAVPGGVVFIGARHDAEPAVVEWIVGTEPRVLRAGRDLAGDLGFAPGLFPDPVHVVFPTTDGEEAHGWFYAPANPAVTAPDDEAPPLLVLAHGGPTGRARTELALGLRYWTSRGFAVVDVDYRGSTGYGRTYRRSLDRRWGVADVDDCIAAAQWLGDQGLADPDRMVIRGSSAGGLTVLGALAGSDVFAAGASRYGVADLASLAQQTHKFEARYCDRLVAPWPEGADIYAARSPINRTAELQTPMIVLQGDADVIVPPNQAQAIVDALAANGVAHTYLVFPGVGHGFRDADTITTALQAELAFFCAILGIEPADDLAPIEIRS